MASAETRRLRRKKMKKNKCSGGSIRNDLGTTDSETQTTNTLENIADINTSADRLNSIIAKLVINKDSQSEEGSIADDCYTSHPSPEPDPLANNPYLNREKCLLCQRDRTVDDKSDSEDEELKIGPHNYSLSQMSLWVCSKCKASLEEEERKGPSFLDEEIETDPNTLKYLAEMQMLQPRATNPEDGDSCQCEACRERRKIQQDQEEENTRLQQCWKELVESIRSIYRETKRCIMENGVIHEREKMKAYVARLCAKDAHQLFQRLESQARDYILEVKVRLLQQLTSGHSTPEQAKAFVRLMLEEYSSLCLSAKILSELLNKLEAEHLRRFNFTWELHDKHLFQSVIYIDPVVQNSLPMLITQLRLGAATKEMYHEDSYPSLLHRYLKLDDEMSVVSVVWRDCQLRLDQFTDEQTAIQTKQRMLREDWEFFNAQRRFLKERIMKDTECNKDSTPETLTCSQNNITYSNPSNIKCLESQFSDAIKSLLDEAPSKQFICPNCKKQRCPCHECSISHLITCGLLTPEMPDVLSAYDGRCSANSNRFTIKPSSTSFDMSIKAPSVSSTDSSCDGESDEIGSGYASSADSWDEKLKQNPNINLFEEFLETHANLPVAPPLKKGDDWEDVSKEKSSNSESHNCACHECNKVLNAQSTSSLLIGGLGSSSLLPNLHASTDTSKSTGLYPHIHNTKTTISSLITEKAQINAAHVASTGSISGANLKSRLYNLHNHTPDLPSPLPRDHQLQQLKAGKRPVTSSTCYKDTWTSKQFLSCKASDKLKFNSITTSATDWDHSSTRLSSSDLLSAPPPPINPSIWESTDEFNKLSINSQNRAYQQLNTKVYPSCLLANPNIDGSLPHRHTDECFKSLHPINPKSPMYKPVPLDFKSAPLTTTCSSSVDQYHGTSHLSNSISKTHSSSQQICSNNHHKLVPITSCQHNKHKAMASNSGNKVPYDTPKAHTDKLINNIHGAIPPSLSCQQSGEGKGGVAHSYSDDDDEDDDDLDDDDDDDDDGGSMSGQSTSTSNSNQKDSKYCDCCYCEFFGNGQPQQAPTSKNYIESRDRLRQRLQKRDKNGKIEPGCVKGRQLPLDLNRLNHNSTTNTNSVNIVEQRVAVDTKESSATALLPVDELVKFITGEEVSLSAPSKLDKKQRKKLKKAEQKARKLEQARQAKQMEDKEESPSEVDTDNDTEETVTQLQKKTSSLQKPSDKQSSKEKLPPQKNKEPEKKLKQDDTSRITGPKNKTDTSQGPNQPTVTQNRQFNSQVNNNSSPRIILNSQSASHSPNHSTNHHHMNNSESSSTSQNKEKLNMSRIYNNLHTELNEKVERTSYGPRTITRSNNKKEDQNIAAKKICTEDNNKECLKNMINSQPVKCQSGKVMVKHNASLHQRQQPEGQEDLKPNKQHNGNLKTVKPGYGQVPMKKAPVKTENVAELDVFLPQDEEEFEENDDQFELELNEFKRFVMESPAPKVRIAVNVNLKELQLNKKKVLTC